MYAEQANSTPQYIALITSQTKKSFISLAVFILETVYTSGKTWASLFSASDNSSEYKYGHEDELSVQANYLRCASVKTYNLVFFFWTHFSTCSSSRICTGDVE